MHLKHSVEEALEVGNSKIMEVTDSELAEHKFSDGEEDDNAKCNNEKLPKHLRHRYWDSQEELYLVRNWRRYLKEITTLTENEPVYRKISYAMRERGINVNSQECRRRISTLFNKYKRELKRSQQTGKECNWRLFHLIGAILKDNINARKRETTIPIRSCILLRRQFILSGIESMRKENRQFAIQRDLMLRDLKLKREEVGIVTSAFESWASISNALVNQTINREITIRDK